MYAIVDIAGQQFKVEKNQEIFVHRLEGEEGTKVNFSEVLLLDEEGKVTVGKPFIKDATITAKILSHDKGDKIIVFHKKRRKGYQKANGHRQLFSKIVIEGIDKVKKVAPKKVEAKKEEAPVEKAAPKKAAPKKPVAKKTTTTAKATTKKAAPKKATTAKTKAADKE